MGPRLQQRPVLPPSYLGGFAAPAPANGEESVWIFRPAIGEWQEAPLAAATPRQRHFNDRPDGCERRPDMEQALLDADAAALPLLVERAQSSRPVGEDVRHLGASFLALMGVLRAPGFEQLSEAELQAGVTTMETALRQMGWVFWVAEPPDYFITSSAPLRVAYPKADEGWVEAMDLRSPGTEITFPLTSRVAIHATWKRTGEFWRRAGEDALMEVNARTTLRARQFLAAPRPAIPG